MAGKVNLEVPKNAAYAIKAVKAGAANEGQQQLAYRYIVHALAALNEPEMALPATVEVMGWRAGRRFVGLQMEMIADSPIPESDQE